MKLLLILIPISFVIGLALGFYLYIYQFFPQQLGTFTNTIPFASIFGMSGVVINLVLEWHKKLVLKFGKILVENNVYFLQILKIRGDKSAEDCEGYITTKDIYDYHSVWRFDSVRVRTISTREYLRLFEVKNEEIIFPSASSDEVYEMKRERFGKKTVKILDYLNENLTVTIGSKNGYKLETTLPISDILSPNPNKSRKKQLLSKLKLKKKNL